MVLWAREAESSLRVVSIFVWFLGMRQRATGLGALFVSGFAQALVVAEPKGTREAHGMHAQPR